MRSDDVPLMPSAPAETRAVLAARYRAHAASSALAEARWATDTVAHGWRRFKIRDWTQIGKTVRYDGPSRPVEHGPLYGRLDRALHARHRP